jgi:hypothetical protein
MSSSKEIKKIYDCVVVGAGLAGLLTAQGLSRQGKKVLLVEATDQFGGANHPTETLIRMPNGLRFIPGTPEAEEALSFLRLFQGFETLEVTRIEQPPVTDKDHKTTSFLGFGDSAPENYGQLGQFLHSHELKVSVPIGEWTTLLMRHFGGDYWPQHQATRFEVEDGKVAGLVLNGQKTVRTELVIFAAAPGQLASLMPNQELQGKFKNEFARQKFVSALQMDLIHPGPLVDSEGNTHGLSSAIHCIGFESGAEPLTTVGRPVQLIDENDSIHHHSQWLAFVADDTVDDPEEVGECLKKMKRAVKRLYPQALEKGNKEKISAWPSIYFNGNWKTKDGVNSTNLKGLALATPAVSKAGNLVGALLQSQLVCGAFAGWSAREIDQSDAQALLS